MLHFWSLLCTLCIFWDMNSWFRQNKTKHASNSMWSRGKKSVIMPELLRLKVRYKQHTHRINNFAFNTSQDFLRIAQTANCYDEKFYQPMLFLMIIHPQKTSLLLLVYSILPNVIWLLMQQFLLYSLYNLYSYIYHFKPTFVRKW